MLRKFWENMDCRQAVRISKRMKDIALLPALAGLLAVTMNQFVLFECLMALCVCMVLGSWALCLARARCPHCGAYLGISFCYTIRKVPHYCPNCGEKL